MFSSSKKEEYLNRFVDRQEKVRSHENSGRILCLRRSCNSFNFCSHFDIGTRIKPVKSLSCSQWDSQFHRS